MPFFLFFSSVSIILSKIPIIMRKTVLLAVLTIPCVRAVSCCEFPAKDEDGFEFTMLVTGFRLKTDE